MEHWKAVPGYEAIYEVSDLGNVKRIGAWSDGRTRKLGLLSLYNSGKRYVKVRLFMDGKVKDFVVHRLVMAAFVGPLPYDHEVNHKNGNKKDNKLENLEYVTHSLNQLHSYRVLNSPHFQGSESGTAKITEDEAIAMRVLRRKGWKLKRLSAEFGLDISTICWICKNKAWRHI